MIFSVRRSAYLLSVIAVLAIPLFSMGESLDRYKGKSFSEYPQKVGFGQSKLFRLYVVKSESHSTYYTEKLRKKIVDQRDLIRLRERILRFIEPKLLSLIQMIMEFDPDWALSIERTFPISVNIGLGLQADYWSLSANTDPENPSILVPGDWPRPSKKEWIDWESFDQMFLHEYGHLLLSQIIKNSPYDEAIADYFAVILFGKSPQIGRIYRQMFTRGAKSNSDCSTQGSHRDFTRVLQFSSAYDEGDDAFIYKASCALNSMLLKMNVIWGRGNLAQGVLKAVRESPSAFQSLDLNVPMNTILNFLREQNPRKYESKRGELSVILADAGWARPVDWNPLPQVKLVLKKEYKNNASQCLPVEVVSVRGENERTDGKTDNYFISYSSRQEYLFFRNEMPSRTGAFRMQVCPCQISEMNSKYSFVNSDLTAKSYYLDSEKRLAAAPVDLSDFSSIASQCHTFKPY